MSPDDGWHGLFPRIPASRPDALRVVLVHGLDEPGTIWDDLIPALGTAGFEVWEFRYPNDQGIDQSADYLAEHWTTLPLDRPTVLIGHSMGGLVARDFVTRWRHPVEKPVQVAGPPVRGIILAGTPNQGSPWARLRVWLELRDQFQTGKDRRYSLFAALRDGTGEAKIDLRPDSDFLRALNSRPWPTAIPIRLIAGVLVTPPATLTNGLDAAAAEIPSDELEQALQDWWQKIGADLGDGVVTLDSVALPEAPPPLMVPASHRGMLVRLRSADPAPPAIAAIIATLREWSTHPIDTRSRLLPSG